MTGNRQNITLIEGIDRINTPIFTDRPESTYNLSGSVAKQINKYKFSLGGFATLSDYSRSVNNEILNYTSRSYTYRLKGETRFKEWPNLELGVEQSFNIFDSDIHTNEFMQVNPYAVLEYDFLNDFILKADYTYNYYKNQNNNQINSFQMGNTSLYYNKEDSMWGFEIDVKNIFDVRYRNSNSFNQFLVTDEKIYIQPRTVMFKVSYKL